MTHRFKIALCGGLLMLCIFGVDFAILSAKHKLYASADIIKTNAMTLREGASRLDIAACGASIDTMAKTVSELQQDVEFLKFFPKLKEVPEFMNHASVFLDALAAINANVTALKENGISLLRTEGAFSTILDAIVANLDTVESSSVCLRNSLSQNNAVIPASVQVPDEYLAISSELQDVKRGAQGLSDLMKKDGARVLALFENVSSLNPGGGSIESYAIVTLARGKIVSTDVHDMPTNATNRDKMPVPPFEIQNSVRAWNATDANWFMHFPKSAAQAIRFLPNLDAAGDSGEQNSFDAVIAINSNVMQKLVAAAGPVFIDGGKKSLDSLSFLTYLQKKLIGGNRVSENQKTLLSMTAAALSDSVVKNDAAIDAKALAAILYNGLVAKDIQLYFMDSRLQTIVKKYNFGGEMFALPSVFGGDYFSIAAIDVENKNTDSFIRQDVQFHSTLDMYGNLVDDVIVHRAYNLAKGGVGGFAKTNNDFIKIFTVPYVVLQSFTGNTTGKIAPITDYSMSRYATAADSIANAGDKKYLPEFGVYQYDEDGKNVFGTRATVSGGSSKDLAIRYTVPANIKIKDGLTFNFAVDKQSGVFGAFQYTIKAPSGYVWEESGNQLFIYQTDNLPARLNLTLTLQRIYD